VWQKQSLVVEHDKDSNRRLDLAKELLKFEIHNCGRIFMWGRERTAKLLMRDSELVPKYASGLGLLGLC
jgi:hypothetical protein